MDFRKLPSFHMFLKKKGIRAPTERKHAMSVNMGEAVSLL